MKRRSFLKSLGIGAAGAAMPHGIAAQPSVDPVHAKRRESEGSTERYTSDSRVRSGMALGGIGAGTIELRKDGRFYEWNIFNNFPKETGLELDITQAETEDLSASFLFFKVRYEVEGEEPRIKLLQIPASLNEGGLMGAAYIFPWMEAIAEIQYSARYPFTKITFSDPEMPLVIQMEAWTPFIPHDVKNSALPVAYFDFDVRSTTTRPVHVELLMVARNNAGYETPDRFYTTDVKTSPDNKIVSMGCGGMDERSSTWGQIAMASMGGDSTHYCGWGHLHPYYEQVLRRRTLPNIDDTEGTDGMAGPVPDWLPRTGGRNRTDAKTGKKRVHDPILYSSVARSFRLNHADSSAKHAFAYGWNFPNLYADRAFRNSSDVIEGHYYSNFFGSAFEVLEYAVRNRSDLERRSREFQRNFFESSAEIFVLEQVNSHLNTFASTGRLVKSGQFGMLEGLTSTWSWGPIATIDVMVYATAPIIALFPELQQSTMRAHSLVQSAEGEIQHGLLKNFESGEDGTAGVSHRLDLPSQFVIMVLRDFFWTNDKTYLAELFPSVKRAINYILDHRAFAGDQMPIMRGIESSYDNFPMYGYASYIMSQWLCALAGAAEAALVLGEHETARLYQRIAERTGSRMEEKLWNGKFYRLYNDKDRAGKNGGTSDGCLTDQIVGQWMARCSGLASVLPRERVHSALNSILEMSYRPGFGLRNCSWSADGALSDVDANTWVDQGNTCWTGVELAFASFLLYEGFSDEAHAVIRTVDQRYRKAGLYWSHQEFGGHYFRPMAAWAVLNGLLGFAVHQGSLLFAPRQKSKVYKLFFACCSGTAHYERTSQGVTIRCLTGAIIFDTINISGDLSAHAILTLPDLGAVRGVTGSQAGEVIWRCPSAVTLQAGEKAVIRANG